MLDMNWKDLLLFVNFFVKVKVDIGKNNFFNFSVDDFDFFKSLKFNLEILWLDVFM